MDDPLERYAGKTGSAISIQTEIGILVIRADQLSIGKDGYLHPKHCGLYADEQLRANIRKVRRRYNAQREIQRVSGSSGCSGQLPQAESQAREHRLQSMREQPDPDGYVRQEVQQGD